MDFVLQGWACKRNAQEADRIMNLYDQIFEDAYVFMKQSLKPKMDLLECNYIIQVQLNWYRAINSESLHFECYTSTTEN